MTYNRIEKPRAYMDRLSHDLATGFRTISNYTVVQDDKSTAVTFDAGQIEDLFDMRPTNFAQIAHDTKKFYLQIDTGMGSDTVAETNFLAILGHNMEEANVMFRVIHDDNITSNNMVSANSVTASTAVTSIINATQSTASTTTGSANTNGSTGTGTTFTCTSGPAYANHIGGVILVNSEKMILKSISSNDLTVERGVHGTSNVSHATGQAIKFDYTDCIAPENNGWTLVTWADTADNQYYRIEFLETDEHGDDTTHGNATTNFAADLKIGAIMLGEYINFPHTPDLNVGFDIDYDGTNIVTSAGGSTFANTSYLGSPGWSKTNPWALAASATENQTTTISRHYGRRKYNMNFSYVADTNLFQSNMHASHGAMIDGSDLYSQFYHKILGNHLPFLLSIDHDSTGEGDYGLFRLADGGLKSNQSAHRFWNTKLNLVEHW